MDKLYRHIRPEEVNRDNKNKSVTGLYNKEENTLSIGVSICCINDHFNKKLGRIISEGRALKNPNLVIEAKDYRTALNQFHTFCNTLGGKKVQLKENVQ